MKKNFLLSQETLNVWNSPLPSKKKIRDYSKSDSTIEDNVERLKITQYFFETFIFLAIFHEEFRFFYMKFFEEFTYLICLKSLIIQVHVRVGGGALKKFFYF